MRSLRRPAAANASRASRSRASNSSTRARIVAASAAAVARIAADACHLDGRQARELLRERECAGRGRLPRAMQPDVHLHEQLRRRSAALQRRCEALGRGDPVDGDRQLEPIGREPGESLPLVGAERRVVHEDAGRAGLREDLRLPRLRDCQAARAERQLPQPDLGRLVRLRVRPERDPVPIRVRLEVLQVRVEAVEIDHRDGGLDLAQGPPDLRREQFQRPIGCAAHGPEHSETPAAR